MEKEMQEEIDRRLAYGTIQLTLVEIMQKLDELGYEFDKTLTFNYLNTGNELTWKARSYYIREKDTKKGAFHYTARRDSNFEALQKLRFECFGLHKGRILEF